MDFHIDKKIGILLGFAVLFGIVVGLLLGTIGHGRQMSRGFDKMQNGRMEMRQGKMQNLETMQNKMMMGKMMPNPETTPNMVPVNAVPVQ